MQSIPSPKTSRQQGFTLIELSIVLVIIGLIVGGILTGQSLIKQAALRATLTEINNITASVNAFHDRYNGLPGDLANGTAAGMATPTPAATAGDGLVQGGTTAGATLDGEVGAFFADLSLANMTSLFANGTMFPTGSSTFTQITGTTATSLFGTVPNLPTSGLGNSVYIWVEDGAGVATGLPAAIKTTNYYRISQVTAALSTGAITDALGIQPADAAAIDAKLDDGNPATGNVLAYNSKSGLMTLATANGCVSAVGASGAYEPNSAVALGTECSLAIATGF